MNWLAVLRDLLISGWIIVMIVEGTRGFVRSRRTRMDGRGRLVAAVLRLRIELEELANSEDWRTGALVQRRLGLEDLQRLLRNVDTLRLKQQEYILVSQLEKSAREVESLLETRRSLAVAEVTGTAITQGVSDALTHTLNRVVFDTLHLALKAETALEHYLKQRIVVEDALFTCPECGLTQSLPPDKRPKGSKVSCEGCGETYLVTGPLQEDQ